MTSCARLLIDNAFETLSEIYCEDLDLGVKTEYHCDPDSSIQYSADLQKHLEKPSTLKKRAISIAVNLWMCTSDLHKLAKDQRDELDELRKQLLECQQTVIDLQKQKLQEQSEAVSEIKEAVKTQLESYSSVASSGINSVAVTANSTAQLRKVIKSTVEEEERSRNVVVFGLSEDSESEKRTEDLVAEVCEKVGEKPRVLTCSRIGMKREGTTRPILVSLASASSVQQLLYRAKELRDWDKYGRVFLGPDRSREEQVNRKGLVDRLKKMREDEPGKSFVIRGDTVVLKP